MCHWQLCTAVINYSYYYFCWQQMEKQKQSRKGSRCIMGDAYYLFPGSEMFIYDTVMRNGQSQGLRFPFSTLLGTGMGSYVMWIPSSRHWLSYAANKRFLHLNNCLIIISEEPPYFLLIFLCCRPTLITLQSLLFLGCLALPLHTTVNRIRIYYFPPAHSLLSLSGSNYSGS